jgi:Mg2+ and Co2+ transporter CorA
MEEKKAPTLPMAKKKSVVPRTHVKKTLSIMRLDESGGYFEMHYLTPEAVLNICRECVAERLSYLPFGEVMLRDLRSVDPGAFGTEPKIQVRTLCTLVSLDPIHAFLLPNQILLILGEGADAFLKNVEKKLNELLEEEASHKQQRIDASLHAATLTSLPPDSPNHPLEKWPSLNHNDFVTEMEEVPSPTRDLRLFQQESEGTIHRLDSSHELEQFDSSHELQQQREDESSHPFDSNGNELQREGESSHPFDSNGHELQRDGHSMLHRESSHTLEPGTPGRRSKRRFSVVDKSLKLPPPASPLIRSFDRQRTTISNASSDGGMEIWERPFHLIALDALFWSLSQAIEAETTFVELLVKDATVSKKLEHPEKDTYRGILKAETEVNIFKNRIIAIREAVHSFFQDDKELKMMSFNSVVSHFSNEDASEEDWVPFQEDVSEAENLSENLLFFLDEKIVHVKQAESLLDIANTHLVHHLTDTNNTLLKVTIMIQAITAGGTISAVMAGIFGMNLYSGLMVDGDLSVVNFWVVFSFLVGFMFFFVLSFYYYSYRKGLLDFSMVTNRSN